MLHNPPHQSHNSTHGMPHNAWGQCNASRNCAHASLTTVPMACLTGANSMLHNPHKCALASLTIEPMACLTMGPMQCFTALITMPTPASQSYPWHVSQSGQCHASQLHVPMSFIKIVPMPSLTILLTTCLTTLINAPTPCLTIVSMACLTVGPMQCFTTLINVPTPASQSYL
jgi:hypothetical protein